MVRLAQRFPEAPLVLSSGSGNPLRQGFGGAHIYAAFAEGLGIPEAQIVIEDTSRNTTENARLSKAIADPEPGETWVLITSAWHMPRSVGIFCREGWPVVPYPVDYRSGGLDRWPTWRLADNLYLLNLGVREWIGLIAYRAAGRTGALFPSTCPRAGTYQE